MGLKDSSELQKVRTFKARRLGENSLIQTTYPTTQNFQSYGHGTSSKNTDCTTRKIQHTQRNRLTKMRNIMGRTQL